MKTDYPQYLNDLQDMMGKLGKQIPAVMKSFTDLHHAGAGDGTLSPKIKELIALGIAVTVRCDGCIAYHVHDALEVGATPEEIAEAIGVSVLMGGGPSVVYGSQALEALEQFQARTPVGAARHN